MHEYSVVQSLLEQIENIAQENDAKKVTKIVTKIGVLSGIEVHLLEVAFNTFKEKTIADGAEFVINVQAITIECAECQTVTELEAVEYCCPHCQSDKIKVIDGEDMYLMSVEME